MPSPDARRAAVVYDCLYPATTGGGERVYRRIAELLVERGWSVEYLTRVSQMDPSASFRVVGIWDGEILGPTGSRTSGSAVAFATAVWRTLRRNPPYDLVIASGLPVLTFLAARCATRRDSTVLVADWLEIWSWRKWRAYSGPLVGTVAALLQRVAIRASSFDTVNSAFTASALRARRRASDPVVLGLLDLVGVPGSAGTPTTPPTVVAVGRFIADKRMDLIPAAVAVARSRTPDLRAVLVGDGPERQRIADAIDASSSGGFVSMVGRIDDDERDRLLAGASALVSASSREGFGLTVAEAAAVGTPSVVIAGEENAAAELVRDGGLGAVAADASVDRIADAIVEVVAGGEPLRRHVRDWYSRERERRSLSASVDELLRRYRVARRRESSVD